VKYTAEQIEASIKLDMLNPWKPYMVELTRILRAQEQEALRENCTCEQEEDGGWETDCGQRWEFFHGGPLENQIRFCHGCGKPTKVVPFIEEVGT